MFIVTCEERKMVPCMHTHFGFSIRIKYHIFTREYMFLSLGHKSLIKFLKGLFHKMSYSSASARKKCDSLMAFRGHRMEDDVANACAAKK